MTREEAKIIWIKEWNYNNDNAANKALNIYEKLGMIKFDKPETKLDKFEKWMITEYKFNSGQELLNKVKEIYGEN